MTESRPARKKRAKKSAVKKTASRKRKSIADLTVFTRAIDVAVSLSRISLPFHDAHLHHALIRAVQELVVASRLARATAQPSENGTGARSSASARSRSATSFVSAASVSWRMTTNSSPPMRITDFLDADGAHEEARHSLEDFVSLEVAAPIIIDLEMIDVDEEAAALSVRDRALRPWSTCMRKRRLSAPVSASCVLISTSVRLELLSRRDVDEDAVDEPFAGFRDRESDSTCRARFASRRRDGWISISNSRTEPSRSRSSICAVRRRGSTNRFDAPNSPSSEASRRRTFRETRGSRRECGPRAW